MAKVDLYIVNEVRCEHKGYGITELLGVGTSMDEAMVIFKKEESELLSDNCGYKIINDHQYNWGGYKIYAIRYQNYCSDVTLQIDKITKEI